MIKVVLKLVIASSFKVSVGNITEALGVLKNVRSEVDVSVSILCFIDVLPHDY